MASYLMAAGRLTVFVLTVGLELLLSYCKVLRTYDLLSESPSTERNPLRPSGHYMYRQFNIQQFYVQPTQCIYVFCVDLRTNSNYFSRQH
jgi:hypothetical protein